MSDDRFARQSFLGASSKELIEGATVGIVGLGGGGSHLAQQLAHLGFLNFVIYDADRIEGSNLNRLIGSTEDDVRKASLKTAIAERLIKGVRESAKVRSIPKIWQDEPLPLRKCDVVFGSVDTFLGRHELEVMCRRYFIPFIDVGMDVHHVLPEPPRMTGQVILSMPGEPCMRCFRLLNDTNLAAEAAKYGDVGGVPQVVWGNGLLASAAIGLWLDLLTGWTEPADRVNYLSYDANEGSLGPHPLLEYVRDTPCLHFPISDGGDPQLTAI
jgi:molybdopterin/thiamine biosynthesis adenylyltransferase